ncbi:MAG: haloacid dehalogenase-like hydrolase, partial [Paracoccaceae bacterium]
YGAMTYQPMVELLTYLRDEDFTTYIVSGGGIDFIRAIADDAYGIPPWQVIGSEGNASYSVEGNVPKVIKDGGISFVDDKEGKPVGIMRHIGQRPIFAGGNSDGDFEMLEWTTAGDGPRFGLLVHHTDREREFAYDREGHIGVLIRGLDEADTRGWTVVDMANDWNRIWSGAN